MNQEPIWVHHSTVGHIHRRQIADFGGLGGVRDADMLESASARPLNLWLSEQPDVFRLSAAYAHGIAMNHPFFDCNKRTAFIVSVLFLELNGYAFIATEVDAATTFLSLAAGELNERQLAAWFENRSTA